ncbi:MAG: isochorismatase family protein [Chloroflexota bacterium]
MKKERYFAPETLRAKSRSMLDSVRELRARRPDLAFQPARAALLVLDMQDYFLRPASHAFVPSAAAILPNVQALINVFDAHRRPVIFTRHLNSEEDAAGMGRWWRDLIRADSPDSRIAFLLDPGPTPVIIRKSQYDAFHASPLEQTLRDLEVEQVVITGVMTHLCCETTARAAFVRGFDVFFVVDGTATYTEAFHRASLLNLAHGFAVPVLAEEILEDVSDA